jgi:hypothetical protein
MVNGALQRGEGAHVGRIILSVGRLRPIPFDKKTKTTTKKRGPCDGSMQHARGNSS